jgi:cytochrome c biogenesis protein CcmG/thiol:disulfide interchange protein DsbE
VVKVGEPAPAITGTTIDGRPFDLASLRGRPVVVNFWASWCGPCRDEFPLFKSELERQGAATGLEIVGVLYEDDPAAARAFADEFGMSWRSVTDPSGAVARDYRVVAPPQTYFIDREGIVRSIQIGEVREADFQRQLDAIT